LSFKEAEDVQECFKHLEAWYDENVSLKMKLNKRKLKIVMVIIYGKLEVERKKE